MGYVRSKIDDTADRSAEDIVQDVALRIFSRPENALPINNIPGFVYRAMRNAVVDAMRTKRQRIGDEDEAQQLWVAFAEQFYESHAMSFSKQDVERLRTAILRLKPMYRDIIMAMDFEGYTYNEISQETGLAEGTLMSRRHRAMAQLLKAFEHKQNN